jgi:hypothetical protein
MKKLKSVMFIVVLLFGLQNCKAQLLIVVPEPEYLYTDIDWGIEDDSIEFMGESLFQTISNDSFEILCEQIISSSDLVYDGVTFLFLEFSIESDSVGNILNVEIIHKPDNCYMDSTVCDELAVLIKKSSPINRFYDEIDKKYFTCMDLLMLINKTGIHELGFYKCGSIPSYVFSTNKKIEKRKSEK